MKFLVIGCGSMGMRRIRGLKALGHDDIIVWDIDKSKEKFACEQYNVYRGEVDVLDKEVFLLRPHECYDSIIICVPPLLKQQFITIATEYNMSCFAEADICLYAGNYKSSSTMRFHPAVVKIKELIDNGTLGKIYSFTYHHGSHLDDWRPKGFLPDYYAAKKESSACCEMFCFELSWLSYLFGMPVDAKGYIGKMLNMENVTADDVYSAILKFDAITGTFQCDMVTRPTIRELRISAENGTLTWNWKDNFIDATDWRGAHSLYKINKGKAAPGYNPSIVESMYVDELREFIEAVKKNGGYRYSRGEEEAVIKMLGKVESE